MSIVGVILAGGLSTRMGGGDKGLLPIDGVSLLGRVRVRLQKQIEHVALNANGDPDRFDGLGLPVIADSVEGYAGPLAGVLAAMDWADKMGASQVITVAADTPFFPLDLVSRLRATKAPLAMAHTAGQEGRLYRHPTFSIWPVALREDLRSSLNDGVRKVIVWTDKHDCVPVEFETVQFDPFFNVNEPDDVTTAEAMAREYGL